MASCMKVGFIGFGRMGSALARGIIGRGIVKTGDAIASDVDGEAIKCARDLKVKVAKSNVEVAEESEIVFLCVKPNKIIEVTREIAGKMRGKLLVSIAAGVKLEAIEGLAGGARVVRVMPNTPALVGEGASAYCVGRNASEEDARMVERMLGAVGVCVRVREEEMNAVTSLSCGPAFVYEFVQALVEGSVKAGLNEETAKKLAVQTVLGAAKMMRETGKTPRELVEMVATPGGCTEQGLKVLEEKNFAEAVRKAVEKAAKRADELSKS